MSDTDKYREIGDDEIRMIGSSSRTSVDFNKTMYSSWVQPKCHKPTKNHAAHHDRLRKDYKTPKAYKQHLEQGLSDIKLSDAEIQHPQQSRRGGRLFMWIIATALAVFLIIVIVGAVLMTRHEHDSDKMPVTRINEVPAEVSVPAEKTVEEPAYTLISHTTVNGFGLTVYTPVNAVPTLEIGNNVLDDSTAILVAQAADIRADNGEIVGAYVLKGDLISKGQRKLGFCAIIDDVLTIGIAESTPFLEQALESQGYFFRQYPLVNAGQIIENVSKKASLRKALIERNGEISVVNSDTKLTFNEFSQALVDMGVNNAIYLVGSTSYGYARDEAGQKAEFGIRATDMEKNMAKNINYIVWR